MLVKFLHSPEAQLANLVHMQTAVFQRWEEPKSGSFLLKQGRRHPLALKSTSEDIQIPAQGSSEAYNTKKDATCFLGLLGLLLGFFF